MRHATMPKVVEVLLKGRARVAKGWCQGEYHLPIPENLGGDKYCALGAVRIGVNYAELYELQLLLERALPTGAADCVAEYNDDKGRTQADILALFDRAIEGALR